LFVQVRRRRRRVSHVTAGQVLGLVVLLVVGLAAEYKYVGHGQASGTANVSALSVPAASDVRLPTVASIRLAGTLFDFGSAGSAESAAFQATVPFIPTWTATCTALAKPSAVDIVFESSGRQAANIEVPESSPGSTHGVNPALPVGTYTLVTHAPGTCSWTIAGKPSA
jgi:hypothetical protein